jgi:hypothetical protein
MLRSCCPPSPCGRLSRPRTTTRTPPRPARIGRHRALPGRHQRPGAHGTLPTFAMIRLTGLAAGCTPTAHPAGTRSIPPATTSGSKSQTWSEPPSNRAASLLSTTHVHQVSGRSRNRGASTTTSLSLYLSVSLARARASGSAARPSHCQERLTSDARSRALAVPSFSRPLHQPGAVIPAGTDEMLMSVISFRMAPRGAASISWGSRISARRRGSRDGSSSRGTPTQSGCVANCSRSNTRWRSGCICPSQNRVAGSPASCPGTTAITRCPTTSRRSPPSAKGSSGTGSRRFGGAASSIG